ncbi:PQQ-binding-like beta-propeller repeat protein [Symmachiella dynata]|uniref:outer membrane protein assembly factor BamB family protein n=1 Tax=Symmachiella dynata TaxID=2527995 RepID=UPI0018D3EDD3|nr:PQQ-binding-like beta-propeller repeat protein [Symmachiella dynata]
MTTARILAILTISAISLTAIAPDATAQAPAGRLQESVFLDTDSSATKKLSALEEYLLAEQWSEAVQLANQILEQHGDKLIAAGTGRYIGLRTRCHALLATMNADGLKTLRQRLDPQARQWLEEGRTNHEEAPLLKIVKLAFLSSQGDDALATLGEMAFERGAYGDARGYWEMTLPIEPPQAAGDSRTVLTYPDTDLDQAEMRARLVMCSLFQRDLPRFEQELAAFTMRHGDAEGTLAGRTGRLSEILTTLAEEAEHWTQSTAEKDVSTFAGNTSRNAVLPQAIDDIGAVQWTHPLPPAAPDKMSRRGRLAKPVFLSYFPVTVGDTLFINDATTVSAYDLLTGKPAWPSPNSNDAVIYRTLPLFGNLRGKENEQVGIPHYTMTVHDGRLYVRMGSPVTSRNNDNQLMRSESHLVCLNIATGQGKPVWTIEAGKISPDLGNWEFEGSPIVTDGKLYVALRKSSPQPQANVACFDAENGRLLWNRKVCAFLAPVGDHLEEVSHQLLTLGDGTLFYSTNQGAIAAIAAHDGSLNWVVTYERNAQASWVSKLKNGLVPCLYHQGTVVAAPADLKNIAAQGARPGQFWRMPATGTIMGIDAKTGVLKWRKELTGGVRHLLGVHQNRLVVSGDFLWGIDLDTGRIVWKRGQKDAESYGYGRGLLAGDLVMWPKRESIWVLNALTGNPQADIAIGQWRSDSGPKLTGGNLLVADNMLVIAQEQALVAYALWGRMKKKLREEISAAPDDPFVHLRLARAEHASGDWDSAIAEYRQAVRLAAPQDQFQNRPLNTFATEKLAELLILSAQRAAQEGDRDTATRIYRDALQLSTTPEVRLKIARGLAAAYAASDQPREAVEAWQEILDAPQLSELYIDTTPGHLRRAGDLADAEIDNLLAQHGDAIYETIERRAMAEIEPLPADISPNRLNAILTRYPHALVAARRWLDIATVHSEQHAYDRAIKAYEHLLDHRNDEIRLLALWGMARALEHSDHWREAQQSWLELAAQFPEAMIPDSQPPVTFASYAKSHLERPEFKHQMQVDAPPKAILPLRRSWRRPLGVHRRLLIPVGRPPALQMQSVIIAADRLNCFNMIDGSLRWQAAVADEIEWAAYAGTRLLLSGPRGLEGVSLRTGQRLWRMEYESLVNSSSQSTGVAPRKPQLHFDGHLPLVCFLADNELVCARANDGKVTWRFRPPQGIINPHWFLHRDRCVLQTTRPLRVFVLNAANGTPLADFSVPNEPWSADPRGFVNDYLALAVNPAAETTFTRYGLNGEILWQYPHAISRTNAAPDFLTNGRDVTLVVDGDTLIGVGADDGSKRWSVGLGLKILPHARNRMGIDGEAIYVESEGILRSYQIDDGDLRWEQFLGGDNVSWKIASCGRYLLASPRFHNQAGNFPLLFCDPSTGALVQKLHFSGQGKIDVHFAAGVTLVSSADYVYALARM